MQLQQEKRFKQLLEDNQYSLLRICKNYAIPPIEANDLFQEVVFQIWRSLPSFEGKSSVNTWVYKIALNVCIRSKSKLQKRNLNAVRLESLSIETADSAPDNEHVEQYEALRLCMATLSENDQSLLVLYLENLSYKSIAEIANISENHVAVKMKRIRIKLFNCLKPKLK